MAFDQEAFNRVFGQILRETRRSLGLSVRELIELNGSPIKAITYASYERGDRAVYAARLPLLAELLDTTPQDLMSRAVAAHNGTATSGPNVRIIDFRFSSVFQSEDPILRRLADWVIASSRPITDDRVRLPATALSSVSQLFGVDERELTAHLERLA